MLYALTEYLSQYNSGFNLFGYLTFRSILGTLTALGIALMVGPTMIKKLKHLRIGQVVRDDGPESHFSKAGTPTMGGTLILTAILASTLLWGDLESKYIFLLIIVLSGFGIIGWVDDYKKIVLGNSKGLASRYKYLYQSLLGLSVVVYLYLSATVPQDTQLIIPFFKNFVMDMGLAYIVFGYFVIVGSSNAVNLTDGLDGLAILPTVLVAGALGVFAYLTGHVYFSDYLNIPYISGAGEIVVFCGAIVGAGLGFLWFNAYPAQVFMGDVGALALGAALGLIAIIVRQELVLVIMGGIFVMETMSVMIQVAAYKLTGRRVFRMAPIHHHFELKGWPEPRIIVRFWIITVVLVLIGLASLKVR